LGRRRDGPFRSSLFLLLLAQKKKQEKGTRPLVPPLAGYPEFMPRMGYSSMLPELCKLGFASNSANLLFGSLCGARLRANGNFFPRVFFLGWL
jgi:hypothetical protein